MTVTADVIMVSDFDWQRLPRPIFPLDSDAELDLS